MGEMKEVRCPECGAAIRFEFRATLSADREPEAAKALRRGGLLSVKCGGCGFQSTIRYPMLYTDLAHRAIIRCTATDDEEVLRMTAGEVRKTAEAFGGAALRHRIVTDPEDLREKAEIFHAGLDDRHVEIMVRGEQAGAFGQALSSHKGVTVSVRGDGVAVSLAPGAAQDVNQVLQEAIGRGLHVEHVMERGSDLESLFVKDKKEPASPQDGN